MLLFSSSPCFFSNLHLPKLQKSPQKKKKKLSYQHQNTNKTPTSILVATKHHFLEVTVEEKRMNHGVGIFESNNKDDGEIGMFREKNQNVNNLELGLS